MTDSPSTSITASITLPQSWNDAVRSAVLHAIALAQLAFTQACGRAEPNARSHVNQQRRQQRDFWTREAMRIKDTRMAAISPHKRPRYSPVERLAILELRAACGWSLQRTADEFMVSPATIASWMRRVDEDGPDALVQTPEPVNKFPQLVGHVARRLKTLCPTMGKKKIAETLARAGLHLATTTVGRMLNQPSPPRPKEPPKKPAKPTKPRVVTAKRPNHVWHIDLTVQPIGLGFWVPWPPLALPQCWTSCWWVFVVVDHFSRRVMGTATFPKQPTSEQVRQALGRAMADNDAKPKYIICDKGCQFDNPAFRAWCKRKRIQPPRYGAIGKHGSIAVVERAILTIKTLLALLPDMPIERREFRRELALLVEWFNEHRPHTTLKGQTPNEVYFRRHPANRKPRFEPRERWPRGSPCAKPWALVRGKPGAKLELIVDYHAGRKHLPIVRLKRVA